MKEVLNQLLEGKLLNRTEAAALIHELVAGNHPAVQVAALLTALRMRPLAVDELAGFRDASLELCVKVDLSEFDPIDVCGTGGDGKGSFNISTLSAFVIAGAGVKVAKHGNHGVSSICGSSTVLEALGISFSGELGTLKGHLEKAGICFLHAPLFHPALKSFAVVRRELGIRTFFNVLGPLLNPARPKRQLIGVFSLELARLYHYLFQTGDVSYLIVHSQDGYDEVSLTGAVRTIGKNHDARYEPEDLGFARAPAHELRGGEDVKTSAALFLRILQGNGSQTQKDVVAANAGFAIHLCRPEMTLQDCFSLARESLQSGKAHECFKRLRDLQ